MYYFENFTKNGDFEYDHEFQGIVMEHLKTNGFMKGKDPFYGKPCKYLYTGPDIREGLKSTESKSNSRQRCLAKGISKFLFDDVDQTLARCCAMINRAKLKIYTAEGNSSIFEFLKARIHPSLFYFSEYFGDTYKSGDLVNGIVHEDLQQLSYPDDYFDIVLTAEVMEHVPDAIRAEKEILRVLKPRGGYIFTLPYRPNALYDEVRAVLEDGNVKHLKEPQYHGDPVRPNEGVLVYRIFSERELKQRFQDLGASFNTYQMLDKSCGIINMDAFVHLVIKL